MSGKYEYYGRCVDRCESPIERMFLAALLFLDERGFEPCEESPVIARDQTGIELAQQVKCDQHRIDFVLSKYRSDIRYAIELDGYEYHGKTAQQFERDAIRQRILTEKGYTFIRFTGREVVRDPRKCAREAMRQAVLLTPGGTRPRPETVVKARIRPTTDDRLLELQEELAAAEADGDWQEQLRIAGAMRDRTRQLLDIDVEHELSILAGDITGELPPQ